MKAKPLVLIIVLVWLLSSCNGNTGKVATESGSSPAGNGKMLLGNPEQGLDNLESYHMQAVKEFSGEADGKPEHTIVEITGDKVRGRETEFVNLRQSFSDGKVETILTGVIGDASYRRSGDENTPCHLSWNTKTRAAPIVWPVHMVPAIVTGVKLGEEEVNAVKTAHYRLNGASLGVDYFEAVSGDLWMVEPDGVLVKLELTLSGGEETFGNGRDGTQKLTYDLTKINSNDDFVAPEGCLAVLDGVPIMADAEREYRLPDILRYYSASSPEKILNFYNEKLKEQGWQSGNVHKSIENGQVLLFYKQERNERLHLSLSQENNATLVSISMGKISQTEPSSDTGETDHVPAPTPNSLDPAKAGLPEGVPIYPEAENFTGIPGLKLEFTSADPVSKVMEYYKDSLVKEKWTLLPGGTSIPEAPVMFMKGDVLLIIRAENRDEGSRVEIMVAWQ